MKGDGTTKVELAKEARLAHEAELAAQVKLAEIAAKEHTSPQDLVVAARPVAETCAKVALGLALIACLGLAVWLGRSFDLSAFGISAGTGDHPTQTAPEPLTNPREDTP